MKAWLKAHPRETLALSLLGFPVSGAIAQLDWRATMLWLVFVVIWTGVVALLNAWVLETKGITRHWLWLYLIGAGIVPVLIAVLAKPRSQQLVTAKM